MATSFTIPKKERTVYYCNTYTTCNTYVDHYLFLESIWTSTCLTNKYVTHLFHWDYVWVFNHYRVTLNYKHCFQLNPIAKNNINLLRITISSLGTKTK